MGFGRADRNRYGWPNKVIPYTIHDAAFPPGSTAQKLIEDTGGAIDHWHNNTSIRLVKRQQEADYVVFTPDATACHGPVGRHAGEQQISCALAGDPVAPPGAGVALAKQTDTVLTAVVVDDLGGLSVAWVNDTDGWDGPVHLDGNFRPGAPVGLAKQTEDVLTALAVDEEGVLNAAWVVGTGQWTGPVKFGPANFKPGATPVALAKQTDDILTAVAVDKFGFLNVAWVEGAGKPWNGPVPFGTPEFPTDPDLPVGVALAKQTEDVLTALAVDNNGRLSVASLAGTGQQWQGPAPFGEPRFFKGAPVAMAKQTDDILTAAAVDKDGNLNVAWVVGTGQWEGPIRIGGEFPPDKRKTRKAGKLPSDQHTHVALAKQTDDILTALAIDRTGALNAAWVDGTGEWSSVAWGPANLPPGAPRCHG